MVFVLRISSFTLRPLIERNPTLPVVVQPHGRERHIYDGRTVFLRPADHPGGRFLPAFVLDAGNRPADILLEPAVLCIPSAAMYNAAMQTRMGSLARREA